MKSGNSWPPNQPRTCYVCGKRIILNKESMGMETMASQQQSWHTRCARGPA